MQPHIANNQIFVLFSRMAKVITNVTSLKIKTIQDYVVQILYKYLQVKSDYLSCFLIRLSSSSDLAICPFSASLIRMPGQF